MSRIQNWRPGILALSYLPGNNDQSLIVLETTYLSAINLLYILHCSTVHYFAYG